MLNWWFHVHCEPPHEFANYLKVFVYFIKTSMLRVWSAWGVRYGALNLPLQQVIRQQPLKEHCPFGDTRFFQVFELSTNECNYNGIK